MLETSSEFLNFIQEVPDNGQVVAVVEHKIFNDLPEEEGKHVYAIYYIKHKACDTLYIFDSEKSPCLTEKRLSLYFKRTPKILIPNMKRQRDGETTCHAYAIRDALYVEDTLISKGGHLDLMENGSPPIGFFKSAFPEFKLPEELLTYSALELKKNLFHEIFTNEFEGQGGPPPTKDENEELIFKSL